MSEMHSTPPGRRLIGTAGWGIHKDVADQFAHEGSQLERYGAVFPAVEINSSFYRPHQPQTYARWAASVPLDFRFSVKLPRTVSHDAKLRDVDGQLDALLDRFAREAGELGPKLGCVLIQLPPSGAFVEDVVRAFLPRLAERFSCALALEARHASWFGDAATAVLREAGVIRVQADPPAGQPGPHVPTTPAVYLRLHGSPKIYYSSYPPDTLRKVERGLDERTAAGADGWCIFDNTAAFAAVPNALDVLRRAGRTAGA